MAPARTWIKMITIGTGICVGGPMLVNYVRPTEEELFQLCPLRSIPRLPQPRPDPSWSERKRRYRTGAQQWLTDARSKPQRFNPDLQKRNLENRERRQQDFDDFVVRLKEYSKSDKPIWEVMKEEEELKRKKEEELKKSQT